MVVYTQNFSRSVVDIVVLSSSSPSSSSSSSCKCLQQRKPLPCESKLFFALVLLPQLGCCCTIVCSCGWFWLSKISLSGRCIVVFHAWGGFLKNRYFELNFQSKKKTHTHRQKIKLFALYSFQDEWLRLEGASHEYDTIQRWLILPERIPFILSSFSNVHWMSAYYLLQLISDILDAEWFLVTFSCSAPSEFKFVHKLFPLEASWSQSVQRLCFYYFPVTFLYHNDEFF